MLKWLKKNAIYIFNGAASAALFNIGLADWEWWVMCIGIIFLVAWRES